MSGNRDVPPKSNQALAQTTSSSGMRPSNSIQCLIFTFPDGWEPWVCVCVWGGEGGNPYLWDVLSFQKYLFLALLPLHPLFLFLPLSLSPSPVTLPPSTNPTPNPNRPIWLYLIRTVYTSFEMGRYSLLTKQKALKRSLPLLSSPHTHARAGMLYTISRQQGQEERTEMKRKKLPRFQRHVTCSSNKIISI